jgi:hypothetical protein
MKSANAIANARFHAEFLQDARKAIANEGLSKYFTKTVTTLKDIGYSQAEAEHYTLGILRDLGLDDPRLTNEPKYTLTQKAQERMKFTHREVTGTRGTLCGVDGMRAWPEQEPTCADCRRKEAEAKAAAAGKSNRFTKDEYKVLKELMTSMGLSRMSNADIDAAFDADFRDFKDKTFNEIIQTPWIAERLANIAAAKANAAAAATGK